jgi:ABC-type branched-subunit amino acid transport system substrate-binding protein
VSAIKLQGNASNTGTSVLQSANVSTTVTQTLPTADGQTLGYLNAPPVGTKTTSYTLAVGDVGKYVQLTSSGAIVIPASVFSEGDLVVIYNNTSSTKGITCSAVTTKIAGSDTTVTSATLAIRGVCTVLFIDATNCVLTGSVS